VVSDPDRKETFATAEKIRNEYVPQGDGVVAAPQGTTNPNIASGEVEVLAHDIEILNPRSRPPSSSTMRLSENVPLTHRVIDLRASDAEEPDVRYRVRWRCANTSTRRLRRYRDADADALHAEGARDYLVPSRVHEGEFFALPQSRSCSSRC